MNILSPSTIDGYRRCKKNCIAELCSVRIDKLTQLDVQKHFNKLAVDHSPKTVRNAHGLLVSVLNVYAPDIVLHTTLPNVQKKIKHLPEVDDILRAIKGSDIELPCLLALWLGMRMSEIRGLSISDIQDGILTIHSTVVTVSGQHIEKSQTKTVESTRQLAVPRHIQKLISALPSGQTKITVLSGQAIYKRFSRLLEANGLPHMTFHDLRHMNASIMLMLGVPDKYAMERGGWSSPHIMKSVYQHTFSDKRTAVDDMIDSFFSEKIAETDTKSDTN